MKSQRVQELGFTLLEVTITMGIFMIMVLGITSMLRSTLDIKENLAENRDTINRLNITLARIKKDISLAYLIPKENDLRLKDFKQRTLFKITQSTTGDRLEMTYLGHRPLKRNAQEYELAFVRYELRSSNKNPGQLDLIRGESKRPVSSFTEDIPMEVILEGVTSMTFKTWNGEGFTSVNWDSSRGEWRDLMPHMVRITLVAVDSRALAEARTSFGEPSTDRLVTDVYLTYALDFNPQRPLRTSFRFQ